MICRLAQLVYEGEKKVNSSLHQSPPSRTTMSNQQLPPSRDIEKREAPSESASTGSTDELSFTASEEGVSAVYEAKSRLSELDSIHLPFPRRADKRKQSTNTYRTSRYLHPGTALKTLTHESCAGSASVDIKFNCSYSPV